MDTEISESEMLALVAKAEIELLSDTESEFSAYSPAHEIIHNTHVRLAGFDSAGNAIDPADDLTMLDYIEYSEARYMEQLRVASEDTQQERDEQGLNEEMRMLINRFRTQGMHISRFTDVQREYIRKHGMIVYIEWEVQEGVRVILGALTALSRARWNPKDENSPDHLWEMFPGYDMRDIAASHDDLQQLPDRAQVSFNVCRSTVLPSTNHPLVQQQLQSKHVELPNGFQNISTRRMGLGAFAKAVELLIAQQFGMRFVTSNRAVIRYGDEEDETTIENEPTTGFNKWGYVIGWRNRVIQFGNPLRLRIRELASLTSLQKGLDALIGPNGIATRKGHEIARIRREADDWKKVLESGDHASW